MPEENVVAVVEGEVKAAEAAAEAVVADVKAEVAKVEEKVKAEVVQIVADEKLVLREAELEYLKIQMELQRLTKLAEEKAKQYQTTVEGLFTKYLLSKTEYVFDGTINAFKKL